MAWGNDVDNAAHDAKVRAENAVNRVHRYISGAVADINPDAAVTLIPRIAFAAKGFNTPRTRSAVKDPNTRPSEADVDAAAGGGLAIRKTVNDVDLSFYLSDETVRAAVRNDGGDVDSFLPDAYFSVEVPEKVLGEGMSARAGYHLGDKSVVLGGQWASTFDGKDVEVRAAYLQKEAAVHVNAAVQLDVNNSLAATYNVSEGGVKGKYLYTAPDGQWRGYPVEPPNDPISFLKGYDYAENSGTVSYTFAKPDWSVTPLYDVARQSVRLTGAYRYEDHVVRASYDVKDELAALEYNYHPFRVVALAKASREGIGSISAGVAVEKVLHF